MEVPSLISTTLYQYSCCYTILDPQHPLHLDEQAGNEQRFSREASKQQQQHSLGDEDQLIMRTRNHHPSISFLAGGACPGRLSALLAQFCPVDARSGVERIEGDQGSQHVTTDAKIMAVVNYTSVSLEIRRTDKDRPKTPASHFRRRVTG